METSELGPGWSVLGDPPDTAVVEMQRGTKNRIQNEKSGLLRTIKDALGARNLSNGSWERYELRRAETRICHWWGREWPEQNHLERHHLVVSAEDLIKAK